MRTGYAEDFAASMQQVPDVVKDFLVYFCDAVVNKRDVGVIHNIYEQSWNRLTERYYKNSPWPPVELVAALVNESTSSCSPVFPLLLLCAAAAVVCGGG